MSQDLDPQKYHVLTPKKKRILYLVLLLIFFVLMPILMSIYYKSAVFRPSQTSKEANFEIKNGESVFEIANKLYEKEAINSEFLFILYVFLNRSDTNIQAGTYKIPAGTSLVGVVDQLNHGRDDISLTFIEGWRIEQIATLVSKELENTDYQTFVDMAKSYEGYLFPDTYFFNRNESEEEIIRKMRNTFNEKTSDILTDGNLEKVGLSKEEVVTIASLVEREVSNKEDRPVVAGILLKRLKEGMKLDIDASTQYSIAYSRLCDGVPNCKPSKDQIYNFNWWPKNLTLDELGNKNPYNTRAVVGLPPSPISSVSRASLSSVIDYEDSPYYYYLTDSNGVMHYARTLEEHNSNISKYLSN